MILFKMDKQSDLHLSFFEIVGAWRDFTVVTKGVPFCVQVNKMASFTPRKYKVNLIRTLTFRCSPVCSSPSLLRSYLNELRKLLLQNGYPAGVGNYNINDVLNRQQNKPKNPTTTVPRKETILVLPYLGVQSRIVTKQLKTCNSKFCGCIDLRVIFQSARRIKFLFPTKIGSIVPKYQKLYIRLVVGTARISTLEKRNVDS